MNDPYQAISRVFRLEVRFTKELLLSLVDPPPFSYHSICDSSIMRKEYISPGNNTRLHQGIQALRDIKVHQIVLWTNLHCLLPRHVIIQRMSRLCTDWCLSIRLSVQVCSCRRGQSHRCRSISSSGVFRRAKTSRF